MKTLVAQLQEARKHFSTQKVVREYESREVIAENGSSILVRVITLCMSGMGRCQTCCFYEFWNAKDRYELCLPYEYKNGKIITNMVRISMNSERQMLEAFYHAKGVKSIVGHALS